MSSIKSSWRFFSYLIVSSRDFSPLPSPFKPPSTLLPNNSSRRRLDRRPTSVSKLLSTSPVRNSSFSGNSFMTSCLTASSLLCLKTSSLQYLNFSSASFSWKSVTLGIVLISEGLLPSPALTALATSAATTRFSSDTQQAFRERESDAHRQPVRKDYHASKRFT